MLATVILAAATALPLGVWPQESGPPALVVNDIELYLVEPEDDYWVIAVQPISPPLARADRTSVAKLVAVARRLGADAVLLLGEMPESAIPADPEDPLPKTKKYSFVAYLGFESANDEDGKGVPTTLRPAPPPLRPVVALCPSQH